MVERVGAQATSFVIGIVLARLLSPEDYGLIGISMIFIAFANVFIDSGFSNALIRKLDRTDTDLSTAFYFNLIIGCTLFIIIYISAPIIAVYFDSEKLVSLVRIVAILVLTNSLCVVQNAILTSELRIKVQAIINTLSLIPSGIIGIYMAYRGYGVYSLAIQSVSSAVIRTFALWFVAKWRPILIFSKESLAYLWGFGSKLIAANLLGTVFNEIYTIIIGKFVGKEDLGYYSKARSLSSQPDSICNGVIQKVAIPIFSKYQDNRYLLREKYSEATKFLFYGMGLIIAVLISIAHPLIVLLWSDSWIGSIFPFQMLLIASLFSPPSTLNLSLLQVINHTGYTLKLELVKKPIFLVLIIIGSFFELYGLLYVQIVISILAVIINMKASQKFIGYTYRCQIKDILPYLLSLVVSSVPVYSIVAKMQSHIVLQIILGAILTTAIYHICLLIFKDSIIILLYNKLRTINK